MSDSIVPERIKASMNMLGITRTELGRRAGVGRTTILQILDGRTRSTRLATLAKLAGALGVSALYLQGHVDSTAPDPTAVLAAARAHVPPSALALARTRGLSYDDLMILSVIHVALTTYDRMSPTTPEGWHPFLDAIDTLSRPTPTTRPRRPKRAPIDAPAAREAAKLRPSTATRRTRAAKPAASRARTKRS